MKESYEVIKIVLIHSKRLYGKLDHLGDYESMVTYQDKDIEVQEMMDNEDFSIFEEIVFTHIEEEN